MKIEIYRDNLIITADNVKIEEDVTHNIYAKKEDGKNDYSKILIRDEISEEYLNMFSSVLDEMIYRRKQDYDSSSLIVSLFEKLPEAKQKDIQYKLSIMYPIEEL